MSVVTDMVNNASKILKNMSFLTFSNILMTGEDIRSYQRTERYRLEVGMVEYKGISQLSCTFRVGIQKLVNSSGGAFWMRT
jgi:hypothetical protein